MEKLVVDRFVAPAEAHVTDFSTTNASRKALEVGPCDGTLNGGLLKDALGDHRLPPSEVAFTDITRRVAPTFPDRHEGHFPSTCKASLKDATHFPIPAGRNCRLYKIVRHLRKSTIGESAGGIPRESNSRSSCGITRLRLGFTLPSANGRLTA